MYCIARNTIESKLQKGNGLGYYILMRILADKTFEWNLNNVRETRVGSEVYEIQAEGTAWAKTFAR